MHARLGLLVLCLALAACPTPRRGGGDDDDSAPDDDDDDTNGQFDLSGVPDGVYGVPYTGVIRVPNYSGPVVMQIVAGELSAGLSLDTDGIITGTPAYAGPVELEVQASGMTGRADLIGAVDFVIALDDQPDAFLGYEHDQLTSLAAYDLQLDMWVRAEGGGEPGMSEYTPSLGVYLRGPNGIAEQGMNDDERIGDVAFAEVEATLSNWTAAEELESNPGAGYPDPHIPDGLPPELDADTGTLFAGGDTGEADLEFSHPTLGDVQTRLLVVVPDWCPLGEHEGGPSDDGFCE